MASPVDMQGVAMEEEPAAAAALAAPAGVAVAVHGAYWAVTAGGHTLAIWRRFEVEDVLPTGPRAVVIYGPALVAGGARRSIFMQLANGAEVDLLCRLLLQLLAAGP